MQINRLIQATLVAAILIGCTSGKPDSETPDEAKKKPLNIIFLVGDGMGLSQMSSAYFFGEKEPNFSRFPVIGLSKTASGSHKITDSAAGATAFSCGLKTYNGAIGVDMDTNTVKTILEELSEVGWNTGLVSTSSITHATPASFFAHTASRGMQEEIARQLVYSDVDFFAGGGHQWFLNRTDSVNYADSLLAKGFVLDTTSIKTSWNGGDKKPVYLLAADGLTPKHEGRDDFLNEATDKAIQHLSSKEQSFFLMVEGSQIDWGGHANNGEYIIQEVLDFDKAVGTALDFAQEHGNTLVVVTADHETGGFTMSGEKKIGAFKSVTNDYDKIATTFSTGGHSCTMVPVLSFGVHSERLNGIFENTEIHTVFREITELE
ncbi:MAG: alkaline phosphatase [Flavobacteriales bacterium]|nr:alkaline phosphatase [Flavobacteriales bacterium]